ncbi:hypothetical protein BDP81DRAFT_163603 [Colletotrichum phormii]|uniref:Uncharacterized protein n=1 Tax=Colletotrichum phormii TaxID=359342 RepID=A0AAI9ZZ37_9PEZI|nr:uncharacterized protein BDP81DRAFT_163603 [Colletotrichum phormii]KAK1640455.1 hypothetical protein BDP81DRAFT_163603 [Colletotrichum phormii]
MISLYYYLSVNLEVDEEKEKKEKKKRPGWFSRGQIKFFPSPFFDEKHPVFMPVSFTPCEGYKSMREPYGRGMHALFRRCTRLLHLTRGIILSRVRCVGQGNSATEGRKGGSAPAFHAGFVGFRRRRPTHPGFPTPRCAADHPVRSSVAVDGVDRGSCG